MKKCIVCIFVVALIGVSCYFATDNPATRLPGSDITDYDLVHVCAMGYTAGPKVLGRCVVPGGTFPACTAPGQGCGQYAAQSGTTLPLNTACTDMPVGNKTTFDVVECTAITTTVCSIGASGGYHGVFICSPLVTGLVGVGVRDRCRMTSTPLSEP